MKHAGAVLPMSAEAIVGGGVGFVVVVVVAADVGDSQT